MPKEVFISTSTNVRKKEKWLADLDASAHITSHKKYFVTCEAFVISKKILISNKKIIFVYGNRVINVEMKVKEKNDIVIICIVYSKYFEWNLFSMVKIEKGN